tara:strand:- start:427 stop:1407 length:981 start_codon:yes stop_codon:yes gene_type:complete
MLNSNFLSHNPKCWVLTDGKAGMESQCIALADTLGLKPTLKRVSIRSPWAFLPPHLWIFPLKALSVKSDKLEPPWPDILIATGTKTVALALSIKTINPATFLIQIQNPTMSISKFDIVIAPKHDCLSASNVVSTLGALNSINKRKLNDAFTEFASDYLGLPKPLIGVLIGGNNKNFHLTQKRTENFAMMLREAVNNIGGSLAITPSRRTSENSLKIIKNTLSDIPKFIWNGSGKNPYLGILAHADYFIVTGDSVNMVSEAIATGKPVHVFKDFGGSKKFDRFHNSLEKLGVTRPFSGRIEKWEYETIDEMTLVADAVKKAWNFSKN